MSDYINDFNRAEDLKRFVVTRISTGLQNDGVFTRTVKNSKIIWAAVNAGTETGYFGEKLELPVNAPGDITVEAVCRLKRTAGVSGAYLGIGVNQSGSGIQRPRYGVVAGVDGSGTQEWYGSNNAALTTFPGFPSMLAVQSQPSDSILSFKVVRKNGYIFLYINGFYVGQYAYATTITDVAIVNTWFFNSFGSQRTVDYLRIWPKEVVAAPV